MSSVMLLYSDISVLISLTFSLKNPIQIATPQGGQFKFSPISMYNCFQSFPLRVFYACVCVYVSLCVCVVYVNVCLCAHVSMHACVCCVCESTCMSGVCVCACECVFILPELTFLSFQPVSHPRQLGKEWGPWQGVRCSPQLVPADWDETSNLRHSCTPA